MKTVVCGGRNFSKFGLAWRALNQLHTQYHFTLIIDGKASGADSIAHKWALHNNIETKREPANWYDFEHPECCIKYHNNGKLYNAAAGNIRNQLMLDKYKPDLCIAFPGGSGTEDMIHKSKMAGVLVKRVVPSGSRT